MRVIVIGAGIGGLTAAIALRQRGIDVEIYERSGELTEVPSVSYRNLAGIAGYEGHLSPGA
jgi:2-polyprenyl-6-methoxyphenol hydroxylase-like FAD-dependent oxidoreductase